MSWCSWLGRPHDERVERLLDALSWCHKAAAISNENASGAALINAAGSGARFEHAVASAILTLGSRHGPVCEAREWIYRTDYQIVADRLERCELAPGFGNSFYKKSIDPAFVKIDHLIREEHHDHSIRIDKIGEIIFKVTGKALYPNPAAYTASCAEIAGVPIGCESMLFIACRLPAWCALYGRVKP